MSTKFYESKDFQQWEFYGRDHLAIGEWHEWEDVLRNGQIALHPGDVLAQRYKILHKIGLGWSGTVWLCRDLKTKKKRYYALKTLATPEEKDCMQWTIGDILHNSMATPAEDLSGLCLPLDRIEVNISGQPRLATVSPFVGPSAASRSDLRAYKKGRVALRQICLSLARSVAILHQNGICHGDIRSAKVLMCPKNLSRTSEKKIYQILGEPKTDGDTTEGNVKPSTLSDVERYWVSALQENRDAYASLPLSDKALLINFDRAYKVSDENNAYKGPQVDYASPEWILDGKSGFGNDLWGLGYTIYEIRTGRHFDHKGGPLWVLITRCKLLGKMPNEWWNETWTGRSSIFADEVDEDGKVVELLPDRKYSEYEPRSIRALVTSSGATMDEGEVDLFTDLLEKIIKWRPEERLSASEIVKHPWFEL